MSQGFSVLVAVVQSPESGTRLSSCSLISPVTQRHPRKCSAPVAAPTSLDAMLDSQTWPALQTASILCSQFGTHCCGYNVAETLIVDQYAKAAHLMGNGVKIRLIAFNKERMKEHLTHLAHSTHSEPRDRGDGHGLLRAFKLNQSKNWHYQDMYPRKAIRSLINNDSIHSFVIL